MVSRADTFIIFSIPLLESSQKNEFILRTFPNTVNFNEIGPPVLMSGSIYEQRSSEESSFANPLSISDSQLATDP